MSKPAAEILQKFYLKLRDHATSADGTPITARQLESLVRLAEARARIDLREEITAQDAMVSSFLIFNQIPLTPSKRKYILNHLMFLWIVGATYFTCKSTSTCLK